MTICFEDLGDHFKKDGEVHGVIEFPKWYKRRNVLKVFVTSKQLSFSRFCGGVCFRSLEPHKDNAEHKSHELAQS